MPITRLTTESKELKSAANKKIAEWRDEFDFTIPRGYTLQLSNSGKPTQIEENKLYLYIMFIFFILKYFFFI